MAKWFRPMWTALRKKERPLFPHAECAGLCSLRVHPVSVSTTRTIGQVPIYTLDNTAARSGRFTSKPKHEPGSYDREVFLVLKEFEPSFSQGGDMAQDFLTPATQVKELEASGESAMKASLAKGMPHGYEVGYRYFTINGRMLGHGEPVKSETG